jgi:hypothetical protein
MEDGRSLARRVGMKLALVIALLLLAVCGALAELVRGRQPVLIARAI